MACGRHVDIKTLPLRIEYIQHCSLNYYGQSGNKIIFSKFKKGDITRPTTIVGLINISLSNTFLIYKKDIITAGIYTSNADATFIQSTRTQWFLKTI